MRIKKYILFDLSCTNMTFYFTFFVMRGFKEHKCTHVQRIYKLKSTSPIIKVMKFPIAFASSGCLQIIVRIHYVLRTYARNDTRDLTIFFPLVS